MIVKTLTALAPATTNLEDSLNLAGGGVPTRPSVGGTNAWSFRDFVTGSIAVERTLFSAKWDHTLGRWAYKAAIGRFDQSRQTCNFYQGICLGERFADVNFTGDQFVAPIKQSVHPTTGTDQFFGGEDLRTNVGRFDIQGQATDHHQIAAGAFYQAHDLVYEEFRNVGTNNVITVPSFYYAKPWDAALYIQDRIEYDFLTVKLGLRYYFGKAGGVFFANPRDPTNGTTAREVCTGEYAVAGFDLPGFEACTQDRSLLGRLLEIHWDRFALGSFTINSGFSNGENRTICRIINLSNYGGSLMDGSENVEIQLTVSTPGGTKDEIDRLTRGLLNDLKEMDVESVGLASEGKAPVGTKGIDPVTTGTIALAVLPTMLPKVLEYLQSWSLQAKGRTIKFKGKIADQRIDFEGSFAEMEKLAAMLEKKEMGKKKK